MDIALASNVVMIFSVGMGFAFFAADRGSATSRVLALLLLSIGMSIGIGGNFMRSVEAEASSYADFWAALSAVTVGVSMMLASEWVLRVRRTIPSGDLNTRFGDNLLRISQLLGFAFVIVGVLFPDRYSQDFVGAYEFRSRQSFWFWVFDALIWGAGIPAVVSGFLTIRRRPERSEKLRLLALAIASPLLVGSLVTESSTGVVLLAIGLVVFLIGAVQYHVLQGQNGLFMRRFLAPQVAQMVRDRGMADTFAEQNVELSAVVCDLRGFTRFAEQQGSNNTIALLRRYYDAVGQAAGEVGATIKDYAGDGLLILVGAPLSYADHRQRAMQLAARLHQVTQDICQETGMGLGVGLASGQVSVGVIGGARLEYVAVGQAVNLASRLCEHAAPGETLVDQQKDAHQAKLEACGEFSLKGIDQPVTAFRLLAAAK